ncbi:hypothetical protein JL720_4541 [Aureococcus anophagefferens]|nr:hypothetical protein JL720_4541 [Aureococcus anophagefferens]
MASQALVDASKAAMAKDYAGALALLEGTIESPSGRRGDHARQRRRGRRRRRRRGLRGALRGRGPRRPCTDDIRFHALYNAGLCRLDAGDTGAAQCLAALQAKPDRRGLAQPREALRLLGDLDGAAHAFGEAKARGGGGGDAGGPSDGGRDGGPGLVESMLQAGRYADALAALGPLFDASSGRASSSRSTGGASRRRGPGPAGPRGPRARLRLIGRRRLRGREGAYAAATADPSKIRDPDDADGLHNLGFCCYKLGDLYAARDAFAKSLAMRRDHEPSVRAVKLIDALIAARERREDAALGALAKDWDACAALGEDEAPAPSDLDARYLLARAPRAGAARPSSSRGSRTRRPPRGAARRVLRGAGPEAAQEDGRVLDGAAQQTYEDPRKPLDVAAFAPADADAARNLYAQGWSTGALVVLARGRRRGSLRGAAAACLAEAAKGRAPLDSDDAGALELYAAGWSPSALATLLRLRAAGGDLADLAAGHAQSLGPAATLTYDPRASTPGDLAAPEAPPGVDPSRRELHLDAAAFAAAFGMDLAAFEALPSGSRRSSARGLF